MTKYREQPCPKCDWRFPGFHVCLDLPKKIMQQVEDGYERDSNGDMIMDSNGDPILPRVTRSDISHREAISAGLRASFATDPERIKRDSEIVRLYTEEMKPISQVAATLNLAPRTVQTALHRARDLGQVTMRPRGRAGRT